MPKDNPAQPLRDAVMQGIQTLTDNQLKMVGSVVDALKVPIEYLAGPDRSDLVDNAFVATMANFLVLHHALHEEPLSKKPFEYVFKQCLIAQGHDAELSNTPGTHHYDVRGDGVRWSLKTEAAAGISARQVKVEKLMEARWIRECATPEDCATEVRNKLPGHLDGYDRIIVMRAFARPYTVTYHLQEIPIAILAQSFSQADPNAFMKNGRSPSFGADFTFPGHSGRTFRILLDSSVEKVRLWYASKYAVNHGSWTIPLKKEIHLDG